MAGGDIDLTMGFNASAGERDSQNFWRKQESQIIGFQNVSKVAFLAFAAAGAAGFKAMSIAAEDGSSAAKQQLDSFSSAVRKMASDVGRDLAGSGVVGWFSDIVNWSRKARDTAVNFVATELSGGGDIAGVNEAMAVMKGMDRTDAQTAERRKVMRELESIKDSDQATILDNQFRAIELKALELKERVNRNTVLTPVDMIDARYKVDDIEAAQKRAAQKKYDDESAGVFRRELADLRDAFDMEKARAAGMDQRADQIRREIELRSKLHRLETSGLNPSDKDALDQEYRAFYSRRRPTPSMVRDGTLSTNFGDPYQSLKDSLMTPAFQTNDTARESVSVQKDIRKAGLDAVRILQDISRRGFGGVYA